MEFSFDVIGSITLLGGLMVLIHKKVLKPFFRMSNQWTELHDRVCKIYNEVHTNGGTSLKDSINRIEGRLVGVEQRQYMYLMESPKGIFETDTEGRFTSVNRTYCRMTGKTERELLGMNWINSISGEDRDRVFENWTASVEEKMEFICKYDMIDSDQKYFSVSMVAYPMENPATKQVIGWLGTVSTVDE